MSEGKFAALRQLREREPANHSEAGADQPTPAPVIANPKGKGRPPGKRSDPAWKQFSVLLKRDTQREAATILRAKDEGLDLSGLVQTLLESWIKRQKS